MYFYTHKIYKNEQNILLEMYCTTYVGFSNGWSSYDLSSVAP